MEKESFLSYLEVSAPDFFLDFIDIRKVENLCIITSVIFRGGGVGQMLLENDHGHDGHHNASKFRKMV